MMMASGRSGELSYSERSQKMVILIKRALKAGPLPGGSLQVEAGEFVRLDLISDNYFDNFSS